jgi:alkanesulfonate monooxygenase SsuD/methylene tetrahydromethanopterin reductase-like flavin-dependent oxidoreductase (luciferase family)
VILPAINAGSQKAGRPVSDVKVAVTAFAASTPEEQNFARMQIAFYASTPSYRRVFALHGWEEIAEKLSKLALHQDWGAMGALIDDEILATFAVLSPPAELGAALKDRYQDLADHLTLYLPFTPGEQDDFWRNIIAELKV